MPSAAVPAGGPWYSYTGRDGDVVVSTRVRLARNLADFLFPSAEKKDESERVQTLVFDAFSRFENPDDYHLVTTETLDALGKKILEERGVLDGSGASGIVMKGDGRLSCRVNSTDHVRIASFEPGLNCARASMSAAFATTVCKRRCNSPLPTNSAILRRSFRMREAA